MITQTRGMNLRVLQHLEKRILENVVNLCEENDLTYYISGGTYLGAVRHQGFIPWDDDIDIALPRDDYRNLLDILAASLPSPLKLVTYENTEGYNFLRAQVWDPRINVVLTNYSDKRTQPVWIDIFPLDGVPNPGLRRHIWKLKLRAVELLWGIARIDEASEVSAGRSVVRQKVLDLARASKITKLLDAKTWTRHRDDVLQQVSFADAEYCINAVGAYKFKSIFNRAEVYGSGSQYSFEGMSLNGPANFDFYLTQIYGAYLELPPVHARNWHGTEISVTTDFLSAVLLLDGSDLNLMEHLSEIARDKASYLFVAVLVENDSDQVNVTAFSAAASENFDEIVILTPDRLKSGLQSLPVQCIFVSAKQESKFHDLSSFMDIPTHTIDLNSKS